MTNAEARFNNSLRPWKPEGSIGRTAQDVHLDSHTAPELWRAQRTSFNTLVNWGRKTPTQSKRKRTGKKGLKGHGPEHTQYTRLHFCTVFLARSTLTATSLSLWTARAAASTWHWLFFFSRTVTDTDTSSNSFDYVFSAHVRDAVLCKSL